MRYIGYVMLLLVFLVIAGLGSVQAQFEDCYEEGEFGPTCPAETSTGATSGPIPTSTPVGGVTPSGTIFPSVTSLPGTPRPTLPVSGRAGTTSLILFGGTAIVFAGFIFGFARRFS